jgi:hypothetical protein
MPETEIFSHSPDGILSCGLTMMAPQAVAVVMGVGGLTGRGR